MNNVAMLINQLRKQLVSVFFSNIDGGGASHRDKSKSQHNYAEDGWSDLLLKEVV